MKKIFVLFAACLGLSFAITNAQADHFTGPLELQVVQILDENNTAIPAPIEGKKVTLVLRIMSRLNAGNYQRKVLTPSDLVVLHEKLFHFFGFDAGLTNFVHEHPVYDASNPGVWKVDATFKQAGNYHLWADVAINTPAPVGSDSMMVMNPQDGYECTGTTSIQVMAKEDPNNLIISIDEVAFGTLATTKANSPQNSPPTSLEPKYIGSDNGSVLTLIDADKLVADQMAMITLQFSRTDATTPKITPYLGAIAHFVITNLDGSKIYHVHPMEMDGMEMIHTKLPAGDYRVFSQFLDDGVRRTVELAIHVK